MPYQAPLYGRSTANLLLQPLPFEVTQSFYPHYAADARVAVYDMFGGVPVYWQRFDTNFIGSISDQRELERLEQG